ncbi:MAG: hypothetical protein JKY95_03310 [Planctomycetaceae bacterium]|nr:hypothetical protein [Planctomycetaceae bacterium]
MNSLNNFTTSSKARNRREGFGVTEMIVALLMLGVMVSYILPLIHDLSRLQQRISKQTLLQQTAWNLVEELHTFSAVQLQDVAAIRQQLETQIDTKKYHLVLTKHSDEKPDQPVRFQLELQPKEEKEVLTTVKLSTWISIPQTTQEAS